MGKKNKIIENVKIEKVGFGGIGIAHNSDGKIILVSGGVLPGMIVNVKILKKKSDFIKAQAIKIINNEKLIGDNLKEVKNLNAYKINNNKVCKHNFIFDTDIFRSKFSNTSFKKSKIGCGGCKWQIIPYEDQIKLKEQIVKDSFSGTSFFDKAYSGIIPSKKIFNYRNKMEFSFGKYLTKEKVYSDWSLGFHKQGQFSKIVDVDNCLIAGEKINIVFNYLKNLIKKSNLPVYDQFNHSGFLRHLLIREGINTGQILVNLVVASKYLEKNKDEINKWKKLQETLIQDDYLKNNVTTFIITENNGLADVIKGPDIKLIPLWGGGNIFEKLIIDNQEIIFRISTFSFFQTNTHQAQILFQTAKNMLPSIKGNILDLYCGTGTIGISLLKIGVGEKLIGVEIVEDAVKDAYKNAEINGIDSKAKFISDKAENINFKAENIGLIVIDPPRSGLHKNVIKFLIDLKNKYNFPLLYISCNPVTMARDLKMLEEGGWNIQELKAVDMFPHTHHIEMIGLLK